jgi:hypothetical protein
MKKITMTIVLMTVLSASILADGEMHTGGRSCPQNTTCLVAQSEQQIEKPFYIKLFEFLGFK